MNDEAMAGVAAAVDLDQLIAELDAEQKKLPEAALLAARAHAERITPKLIDVLNQAVAAAEATGRHAGGSAPFYALFLLTEFRAKEALPAVLRVVSLPGTLTEDMFGDVITESLPGMLALLADSPDAYASLIDDPAIDEYVRWSMADSYLYFVAAGRMSREAALAALVGHLRAAIAREDVLGVTALVSCLRGLGPREVLDDIRAAYDRELVDESLINLDWIEETIAQGEEAVRQRLEMYRQRDFSDAVEELRQWFHFSGNDSGEAKGDGSGLEGFGGGFLGMTPEDVFDDWDEFGEPEAASSQSVTIRNSDHRVGRNDPCPCGSGRKFKKCCGAAK